MFRISTVRFIGQWIMYTGLILNKEVIPMNETNRITTSTPAQQIIGALYLLALLAAIVLILL